MFDGIDSSDDWPVESVRRLEELLRCPICGEFLKHCVQLNGCSHTFCGVCIRKAYNERKRCPICHLQITGSFLTVSSIDSIVSQFQAARNDLLSLSRKVPTLNSTISDQGSLNSPLQNSYSLNSSPSPKPSPDKSSFKPLQSYQNWEMANQVVGNGHEETVAIIVDSDHEDPSNHELDGLAQLHSSDSDDTIAKVKHDEFTDDGWEDDGPQMRVHEPQAESHF
ncbi:putative E3 ubiquitin-protein ligase RAD18 [Blattamonas nauphoetae]|uniref:E3 ubiquitin-protein ligase RAD18 n=1 Tax=Blattamonas nauphoetae TaxID=2049346 RepID=A0ABQ9YLW3_9EUKA|nr:putative E3 ubiquitin-protein ligase RAD18 [Blattamonas nauphoetae]